MRLGNSGIDGLLGQSLHGRDEIGKAVIEMTACRRFWTQRESRRSCRRSCSLHRRAKRFTEPCYDIVTNTGADVVSEDVVGALTEQRRWIR